MSAWNGLHAEHIPMQRLHRKQRNIVTMAMPTIESVLNTICSNNKLYSTRKQTVLNAKTTKLYGQSHKSGINYFNCIWLVLGAYLSSAENGWKRDTDANMVNMCNRERVGERYSGHVYRSRADVQRIPFAKKWEMNGRWRGRERASPEVNYVRFLICSYFPIEFQMEKKKSFGARKMGIFTLHNAHIICALCLMHTAFTRCLMAAFCF